MAPTVFALLWAALAAGLVYRLVREGSGQGCLLAFVYTFGAPLLAFMSRDWAPAWAWWVSALAAVGGALAAIPSLGDAGEQRHRWLASHALTDAVVLFPEVRYVDGLPVVARGSGDVRVKNATLYVTAFSALQSNSRFTADHAPPPTAIPLAQVQSVEGADGDVWGFPLSISWRTVDGVLRSLLLSATGAYNMRARNAARELTRQADAARAAAHGPAALYAPPPMVPPAPHLFGNDADFFDAVLEALAELQRVWARGNGSRVVWDKREPGVFAPYEEADVQREIATFLQSEFRRRGVSVYCEPVPRRGIGGESGSRVDVLLTATLATSEGHPTVSVVVEVKCQYNPGVLADLSRQLVARYMPDVPDAVGGIYVVVWFDCPLWNAGDDDDRRLKARRHGARAVVEQALQVQASDASTPQRAIRAIVLDATLR